MGLFGSAGLKSAFSLAQLVGKDIVARSISLTQAAGSNAVSMLDGAFLNFSTADASAKIRRSAADTLEVAGLLSVLSTLLVRNAASTIISIGTAGSAYVTVNSSGYVDILNSAILRMSATSDLEVGYTDSSGTPGNASISKLSGRSAIAAGASTCVITNGLCLATTRVFISPRQRDATGLLPQVTTVGAGSFTVSTTANCTAALTFDWHLLNGTA